MNPEFIKEAKQKCKWPFIALCIVLTIVLIAMIIVLCIKPGTQENNLQYDDPGEQMMGNPNNSDDYRNAP